MEEAEEAKEEEEEDEEEAGSVSQTLTCEQVLGVVASSPGTGYPLSVPCVSP